MAVADDGSTGSDALARLEAEADALRRRLVTLERRADVLRGGPRAPPAAVDARRVIQAAVDTFRHLVEMSPFGVYAVDADFRLVQVSAGAQKVFANVRPLLGRDFAEVLRIVWPEPFASEAIGHFRRVLETGVPYHAPRTIERRGDIDAVESYDWKVERAILPDGRPGAICHFYDLSERQRYEAALREREERLGLALERAEVAQLAAGAALYEYHPATGEVVRSPAIRNVVGRGPEEIEHTREGWRGLILPEDVPGFDAALEASIRSGAPYSMEYRIRHRDGQVVWLVDSGRVVRDEGGRVVRMVGMVIDISGQKAAEEALREADRRKDEFLAMLAHELRNPLAPLANALALLRRSPDEPAAARARDRMERQVHHLVRLVDDLLDVSRVSRGLIRLERAPLDLALAIRQAVETTRPAIETRGHTLEVTEPAAPLLVQGDLTRLAQVIANLLHNAAKYTDPRGHLRLEARREGEEAVVRVRDDGRGIAPAAQARLFELFYQVDHTLDRADGGLGVGLALVKRLVEMHGGRVEVHSAGRGAGSEFVVRLPALPAPAVARPPAPPAPKAAPAAAGSGARRLRVLVVDDNRDSAETMADLLRLEGHEALVAHDGREAVALALSARPDVVLLDIGLPGMDGHAACRAMRAGGLAARIVAMTGYGQAEDQRRSREAGFDAHLVKPVAPEALHALLAG